MTRVQTKSKAPLSALSLIKMLIIPFFRPIEKNFQIKPKLNAEDAGIWQLTDVFLG
ncbi:hypothetical protein [Bacillus xiapuensis]|uniref:hypothetical protein n=1 Tax=Bacillus xiapuensis TaxID=2014075 RepID=UPI001E60A39C|nr:hypothetical protein [Bacillus xiapuensis]